ncbi:type II toxin-antitoxin system VapC family toxin [bacterium]|nr:type II toxin-antitoxin system VapC family toxin [bacterium]
MGYVDTSVLVAYYCPERLSAKVEKALLGLDAPAISPLVEVEFHSAIARKVRLKELDAADATLVLSRLRAHLADGYYRVVSIEAREYGLARDWIDRLSVPLRTLDSLHLAVAFAHGLEVLTADKPLARAAKHLGVRCRLIA